MVTAAKEIGLPVAEEIFADRAYEEDCSLVARTKKGAIISDEDEAVSRAIGMIKNGSVKAITGKEIPVRADSICVHGDGEKALLFVEKLNKAFKAEGIIKAPLQRNN
jgi:UPF0271 protein